MHLNDLFRWLKRLVMSSPVSGDIDAPFEGCPFCGDFSPQMVDGHIFPAFLGGRQTSRSCRSCDNTLGHEVEGPVSQQLEPVFVQMVEWGLPIPGKAKWRNVNIGGMHFDFVAEDGVTTGKMRPTKIEDEGQTIIWFETEREVRKALDNAGKKGSKVDARLFRMSKEAFRKALLERVFSFQMSDKLGLFALKLSLGLHSMMTRSHPEDTQHARSQLSIRPDSIDAIFDFRNHEYIEASRPPLCHTIYVERARNRVYSVVQLYGSFVQLFCPLGERVCPGREVAMLASLDPITREERFIAAKPLDLAAPPSSHEFRDEGFELWRERLREAVIARGATHPPLLVAP